MKSFPAPLWDSPAAFPDIWKCCTKMTWLKSSLRQFFFFLQRVVEGVSWTVPEMAAQTKLLRLPGSLWLFLDFMGIHLFVSLHCVKSQSAPWERSYSEQAATLRKLHPKIGHFLEKVMARRLAWFILALKTSNKTPFFLGNSLGSIHEQPLRARCAMKAAEEHPRAD